MKICNRCGLTKILTEFPIDASKKDGHRSICRGCTRIKLRAYRLANKDKIKEKGKQWYQENRERIVNKSRTYYRDHRPKLLVQRKSYRERNRNRILKSKQNYYQLNKHKINQQIKRLHNLQKLRDPAYKALWNLRNRLYYAITRNGHFKSQKTLGLLGCDREHLKSYLESLFQEGMNWDNYGQWHIDHIKPCRSFDLSKLSEQQKCFHYSNLQPLWAKDNLSKGPN